MVALSSALMVLCCFLLLPNEMRLRHLSASEDAGAEDEVAAAAVMESVAAGHRTKYHLKLIITTKICKKCSIKL
jgi:hypothetical protein